MVLLLILVNLVLMIFLVVRETHFTRARCELVERIRAAGEICEALSVKLENLGARAEAAYREAIARVSLQAKSVTQAAQTARRNLES